MNRFNYPRPPDENAFEDFCLVLLRDVWSRPRLERYGHRGERQHGVDLLDMSGMTPLRAVQCKHHDESKALRPSELQAEVTKALNFPDKIGEYFILTTAKKAGRTQNLVRKLNEAHRAKGLFTIQLMTWDQIEALIGESPAARQMLNLDPTPATARAVRAEVQPLQEALREYATETRHADLDEAKAQLEAGEPQVALVLLERVRRRSWTDLSAGQRSRLCTLEGEARIRLGESSAAARSLLEARAQAPDDERAAANEILAYELVDDFERARTLAIAARDRFPLSPAAHAAFIELAENVASASAAIDALPSVVAESAEVLAAIASRRDVGDRSIAAARRGVELFSSEMRAWFALGSALLDRELEKTDPGP